MCASLQPGLLPMFWAQVSRKAEIRTLPSPEMLAVCLLSAEQESGNYTSKGEGSEPQAAETALQCTLKETKNQGTISLYSSHGTRKHSSTSYLGSTDLACGRSMHT